MNGRRNVGRVLGHAAVVMVILAVIAAAFAISYEPVRDIAQSAGVQSWLIRIYPGVLDAVFLVACACALLLRGARWWNRLYAWFSVLITGALIGAADVSHATGLRLPRRTMDGTVWALPWALVLLGFSLWLTTLQRKPAGPDTSEAPETDAPVRVLEGTPAARAALPAAGLAEVGFGTQAARTAVDAQSDGVPADIERVTAAAEPPAAAGAAEPAEVTGAEPTTEPHEPAESHEPAVPPEEPAPAEATARPEPAPPAINTAETDRATDPDGSAEADGPAEPESAIDAAEATGTTQAGETAQAGVVTGTDGVAEADGPAEVGVVTRTGGVAEVGGATDMGGAAEPGTAEPGTAEPGTAEPGTAEPGTAEEPEWPFGPGPTQARTTAAAPAVAASDDDTPPYGFPAVTAPDDHDPADRMPTLLSAPVPADMETAPAPAEEERGAKGQPPAAATELPASEAELSHEATSAPEEPAPFERVRSTPTRPEE